MSRRNTLGKNKVSIRVLLSQEDYAELEKIAELERTDVGTLVRRAIARFFLVPAGSPGNGCPVQRS